MLNLEMSITCSCYKRSEQKMIKFDIQHGELQKAPAQKVMCFFYYVLSYTAYRFDTKFKLPIIGCQRKFD